MIAIKLEIGCTTCGRDNHNNRNVDVNWIIMILTTNHANLSHWRKLSAHIYTLNIICTEMNNIDHNKETDNKYKKMDPELRITFINLFQ